MNAAQPAHAVGKDNRYGFLQTLPSDIVLLAQSEICTHAAPPWATTSMVPDARNHCASVMAVNALLCLSQGTVHVDAALASRAYKLIGPGPILRGARAVRRLLHTHGITARSRVVLTERALTASIAHGRPAALLVRGPDLSTDWHWVLAVGYTAAAGGRGFIHVADGWHARTRYFENGAGSRWICGIAFEAVSRQVCPV